MKKQIYKGYEIEKVDNTSKKWDFDKGKYKVDKNIYYIAKKQNIKSILPILAMILIVLLSSTIIFGASASSYFNTYGKHNFFYQLMAMISSFMFIILICVGIYLTVDYAFNNKNIKILKRNIDYMVNKK
jgi:ABC-type multidrug transport system permease subunit